jgi:hypothetical protein
MIHKQYASFEEINQDLRILKLQREVDKEYLKLNIQHVKNSLYPTNLLGGVGGITKKLLLTLMVKKIVEKFSER